MKKAFLSAIAAFLLAFAAHSQSCLPDGITFNTQSEIDNFSINYPGCTTIEGDVHIGDGIFPNENIFNLNGLSGITTIKKGLYLDYLLQLYNLSGLQNLEEVERISITSAVLLNLNGLEKITALKRLEIIGCPSLALDGLQNITSLDTLHLSGFYNLPILTSISQVTTLKSLSIHAYNAVNLNGFQHLSSLQNLSLSMPNLANFNGLQNITSLDSLSLAEIPLTNLSGLNQLVSLQALRIKDCPNLQSLDVLQNMTSMRSISISSGLIADLSDLHNLTSLQNLEIQMPLLEDFSDLSQISLIGSLSASNCDNLVSIAEMGDIPALAGNLVISNNQKLQTLSGLENLALVGGYFTLSSCPLVSSLSPLSNLTSVGKTLFISNNSMLTDLSGLNNLSTVGAAFYIRDNAHLESIAALNNLVLVGNTLDIGGNPLLTSLVGLEGITQVNFYLYLTNNSSLVDLSGLDNLELVQHTLFIQGNTSLQNLNGLGKLKRVEEYFEISYHPELHDILALNKVEYVRDLGIFSNPKLQSFEGLESLRETGRSIAISGLPVLKSLKGFDNLETVGQDFRIWSCDSLISLSGLNNLSTIGQDLLINGNPLLTDISSLKNLTTVGRQIDIRVNANLAECAVLPICNLIQTNPTLIFIEHNNLGCNSTAEVENQCKGNPLVVEVKLNNGSPLEKAIICLDAAPQMELRATNALGIARFGVLPGNLFTVDMPQLDKSLWDISQSMEIFTAIDGRDSVHIDMQLTPIVQVPKLTVLLGMPTNFRSCLVNSDVSVSIQNIGTIPAEGASAAVVLPDVLDLVSSTPPVTSQSGDTLHFEVGSLMPFESRTVKMSVKTSCDTFLNDRTLCVEAFSDFDNKPVVTPIAFSEIKVAGKCINDSIVLFTLKNIGDAPTIAPHFYTVIQDDLVYAPESFSLQAQESLVVELPANVVTWRLEATKFNDGTLTAAAVEGCNGLTPGLITAYWLEKGGPDYDFDCRQVIGAFDPNQKSAVPTGFGFEHTILANQPLQYTIDFQNTGTDTAFRVLLTDILPSSLDMATFRPVTASHPYSWQLSDNKLQVLFFPIALPDSNVNEPASHGYFSFLIDQKPNLGDGTFFENTAEIVFDFNPRIITNTVLHTIGQLVVHVDEPPPHPALWQVLGNPTPDAATFLAKEHIDGDKWFELFDAAGRPVRMARFAGQTYGFRRDGLPNGLYLFRITDRLKRVFTGRIVVSD